MGYSDESRSAVPDPQDQMETPAKQLAVMLDAMRSALLKAGVTANRLPTVEHLTSKILNDWLDKERALEWLNLYAIEEKPETPLDLSGFEAPKKKREIATPTE